jgi:hypothetical protein
VDKETKFKEKLEDMLRNAKAPEAARNLLALLFPKVERALRTYIPSETMEGGERRRRRRLSERDFAPTYFSLNPQPVSWSVSDIDSILNSENPSNALAEVRERIDSTAETDRGRLRRLFLEALDGAFGPKREFTGAWLAALVDFSGSLIRNRDETTSDSMFGVDNLQRLRWVLLNALKGLPPEGRFEIVSSAIPQAADITLLCDFVRSTAGDVHPDGASEDRDRLYFGERTEELRGQLLRRVGALSESGALWSQADPARILWFWWGCNLEDEVREFIDKAMATEEGLMALLRIPISRVRSSAGDYDQINRRVWSAIVDLGKLEAKAQEIIGSNASDARLVLAQRFLEALRKGEKSPF